MKTMQKTEIGQECFKILKNTFKFEGYKSGLQAQAVKKIATVYLHFLFSRFYSLISKSYL